MVLSKVRKVLACSAPGEELSFPCPGEKRRQVSVPTLLTKSRMAFVIRISCARFMGVCRSPFDQLSPYKGASAYIGGVHGTWVKACSTLRRAKFSTGPPVEDSNISSAFKIEHLRLVAIDELSRQTAAVHTLIFAACTRFLPCPTISSRLGEGREQRASSKYCVVRALLEGIRA